MSSGKIIIFSGAGLSSESGISTFRDRDGLWENHKIDEVCNYRNWLLNFDLVHKFYNTRRAELKSVEPNSAHKIIAQLESQYGSDRVKIITQNVDDLLYRAGCKSVMHVHGELTKIWCIDCGSEFEIGYEEYKQTPCPKCQSKKIKPKVVFFYESAPLYRDMYEAFESVDDGDIVVVVGTSGYVISPDLLLNGKGYKILNNLESSNAIDESRFDLVLLESATVAMPKIKEIIDKKLKG